MRLLIQLLMSVWCSLSSDMSYSYRKSTAAPPAPPIPGCAPGVKRQDLIDTILLAAEAVVSLCYDAGTVLPADMHVLMSLFQIPDGEVIG